MKNKSPRGERERMALAKEEGEKSVGGGGAAGKK